jgi:hypothetical protein
MTREYYLKNREAINKRTTLWQKANPEKVKEYKRKSRTGFSSELFTKTLKQQKNRCAICRKDLGTDRKAIHADHNHETKQCRGILCPRCNWLIGDASENIKILKNAIKYLLKWNT